MSLYSALDYVRDHDTMHGLSPTARHLLTVLAVFTGRHGTSHPSVWELAELMGITEANVRRARSELVAADRIAVSFGGGRGRANVYLLRHGSNPESLSTTRAAPRGFPSETRAETRAETHAVPRDQEQEQGEVLTERDAIRAVPPWIAEGISRQQWIEDQWAGYA